MSGILSVGGAGAVGVSGFYPVQINDSLRFNDDDSAYLNRTPSSAGNRKTWTWSGWVKRGNIGLQSFIFTAGADSNNRFQFGFESANDIQIEAKSGGSTQAVLNTTGVFRDPSAWYHILVSVDTTQATSSNRLKLYINGELVTALDTATYPSQNADLEINKAIEHNIGKRTYSTNYSDGYLSNIHFIDGQALDATSFGEAKDGTWIPKSYSGSYGTNGFHLEFNGNTNDTSGNSNNWTANNISAHDYVPDSPTNGFATFNPLMYRWASNTTTLSEGNLKSTGSSGYAFGTINIPTSGKWYFETYTVAGTSVGTVGVGDGNLLQNSSVSDVVYYFSNGNKSVNGTVTAYGATWTTGDVIGVACDADSNTVTFYKNGSSQGSISYDPSGTTVFFGNWGTTGYFVLNHGQDSTFAGNTTAGSNADGNGIGDFKYSVPSGFLALCTANLPTPTIVDGSEYFNTVLYTGDGTTSNTVNGVGFQSDFTWIKRRDISGQDHVLQDVVRGFGFSTKLASSSTKAEGVEDDGATDSRWGYVASVGADSITLSDNNEEGDQTNKLGGTYAAWNWKAGTAFSNSAGSNGATIASSGSVNTDAGFSIVSYTGTGANATVGHGLSATPEMIIVKVRSTTNNWAVYHSALGNTKALLLDTTNAGLTSSLFWNNTSPTSSVFSVSTGNSVNNSGQTYIAYCFANTEGYSKVGIYTGNGSTDGTFVYTGFRPAWVMLKETNNVNNWILMDSKRGNINPDLGWLYPDLSAAEEIGASRYFDFVSNGFKSRNGGTGTNRSGGTYIYLAFAEHPFKYANAR